MNYDLPKNKLTNITVNLLNIKLSVILLIIYLCTYYEIVT